jgi:amino acid adenylation domain-containing protein
VNFPKIEGSPLEGVAIIGMAGRFPGARSVAEFWKNQVGGIEAISHFQVEDLEVSNAAQLACSPNYVRARSILKDVDLFDAEFFGIYPREAELMDPQQRLFLECCWETFEDAGYDPFAYPGSVGVYAGSSTSTYFLSRLCASPSFIRKFTGGYQIDNYTEMMGNNLDFLSTRVSYKLNLRGPSFTMQAGCSTSLVAICQACQSLLTYQCDMALAGGSSITFPQKRGSYYQEGGMVSPDGHCRTFDSEARGTVFGSGVAVVLLKRLEDALRDGDQVYAVIRGFAVNNDGSAKVGYTAPSVEGQARVIAMAHVSSGVEPETIGYIEAHGTGTPLGDPIELTALTRAFRSRTARKQFCVVGTAKTNVGHLDIASGVTGLIHATHIVRTGLLPPTLHFHKPNPELNLDDSPFYVNSELSEWKANGAPRRAGVSAFGVGGTNAHVVLEQAPAETFDPSMRPTQLLVLSARSEAALDRATRNLANYLKSQPDVNFADAAWTLQTGRRTFPCRRTIVAHDVRDTIAALSEHDRVRVQTRLRPNENTEIGFLFPGQGSQHANMGRKIYQTERVFRETVDRCAEILVPHLGADLRIVLFPPERASEETKRRVIDTIVAQPAIFTIEYALAQLWLSWGIRPQAMLGHSIGEFVAACVSGVFSLEDALALVAARGKMMQDLPAGGMLSVRLSETEVRARLNGDLSVAAVNAPLLCVVAGPFHALEKFERELIVKGIACRRLMTSHAFHSAMMDPIIEPFTQRVAQVPMSAPQIPYISGVTGKWITENETTNPAYWARHFREVVKFSAGITELLRNPNRCLVEVGPGNVLSTLARQHTRPSTDRIIVSSLSENSSGEDDAESMVNALGSLWLAGAQPNWHALHQGEQRRRISLPTYPFERKRYWVEAPSDVEPGAALAAAPTEVMQSQSAFAGPQITLEQEPLNVNAKSPSDLGPVPSAPSRTAKIQTSLLEIFEEFSGMDLSAMDASTTFLEMGFDSLFLTQVSQSLQNRFGLKVTFRQLLGDQSTLEALAGHLDNKLPADEPPASGVAPLATVVASESAESALSTAAPLDLPVSRLNGNKDSAMYESAVERLMREQLNAMNQLFAKQLETIRGASLPSTALPAAPSSGVPSEPTSAALIPEGTSQQSASVTADKNVKELTGYTPFKPLPKGNSSELTAQQQKYIAALVERYTKRTLNSKQKTQEFRKVLADPRVVSGFRSEWKELIYPIIAVRSKGSHLWDLDGNDYVDILNGFGPIMLGHRPDFVENAIQKQLFEGFEIGPQTLLAGEVAKSICAFTGNERTTFCNTGSEAVIAAMRVARTVTGRNKILFFAGDYHGMFDEVLVKGFKKGGVPHAVPLAPGIPRENVTNIIVLEYGTTESLEWIRQNAKDLAAVMVEPVQSRHPDLQPIGFLKELRKITQESGTCLVFDEVVTGFRVHPGGCQALFGIRADLATYGKVLAGGMPIGVLSGKAQYMDALDGGTWQFGDASYPEVGVTFFAGTFVRHPLTLAAVKAVLEHFKENGPELQQRLTERTGILVHRLNEIFEANHVPSHIENFASIFYFSFPSDFRFGSLFYYHLRAKGIYLLEGFPCFLTTAHTNSDIECIVCAFRETVTEMQDGGILPELTRTFPLRAPSEQPVMVEAPKSHLPSKVPITESQLEVWLSDQLGPEASCSYNESFTLHLRGSVNETALCEALNQMIQRHEALRSTFDREGKLQYIAPSLKLDVPVIDLSDLSAEKRQAQFHTIIEEDAHTPFQLNQGPLVRTQLVRMEPSYKLLIFTSHHIVCDGWSTNVLLDELAKCYNGLNKGVACNLPPAMSFGAYARSQADFVNSQAGIENEKYWVEQFREPAPLLDLPTDHPRPAVKEFHGATYRKRIGAEAYNNIKRVGAQQKCTLFVSLLAALQILLSRLTGQDDIVIGIPSAGQSLVEDSALVGHCVNFLPLRGRTKGDPTVAAYLSQMRQTLLDAYDHQNYTYGRLVRKLTFQRDPSRLPLTEVQFNLERIGEGLHFDGFDAEVDPNPKNFVNFDIFLNVVETRAGLILDCDYNVGLYDQATIARWLSHYEALLEAIVIDVNLPISRLPLLNEADQWQLNAWNETRAEYPRNLCVHQLFEAEARQNPAVIAAVFEGEELSYAELNGRANQLANYLRKLGVKPGVLVGVFVERSLDMIVGLLGVMKAGGAYVPMDPTYPADRISFVLTDASVPVLLIQEKLARNVSTVGTHLVYLDAHWGEIARESRSAPAIITSSDDNAYVIYTSGSTGKPKGVEISHRAVVNLLCSMRKKPGLDARDTLLAVTTLSFDIAALELLLPLCVGAKLVIASRETAADGNLLLARLTSSGATVLQATPVTFRFLIEAGWTGNPKLKVLCGGEALSRELANQLLARSTSVWNMYGPTETTIWSSTIEVPGGDSPVPIGLPIDNTCFYVLDSFEQLSPIGVPGELHIGGDGLAHGYFRRPELTAAKFIHDPFRADPSARMYKTGDLVRRLANGNIEFLGRLDHQVKLRGFRIELGEIETALARLPGVCEAAVILREDIPGDKRLVAYLMTDQQALTIASVREFLTGKLPNYMLPSAVVRMDTMPLTPNGKVDRRALPAPDTLHPSCQKEFIPPRSPQQKTLADIWAEVLHLERVGIQDNLFELGADSLHIFQIAARASKAGIDIKPAHFLKFRTIASLLEQWENGAADGVEKAMPKIVPVSREKYRSRQL